MCSTFILESSSSNRKFKCPYCEFRGEREDLVFHVFDEHEDLIPEGYTAARVVFNSINKKTSGACIVCRKETSWNEDVWKYERICSEKCSNAYSAYMKRNMVSVHGKPHLLNDPNKQIEMLANRKISGSYTFQDGGVRTYTGSYEMKLLEFYDKVMNVPSIDIQTPGPIFEYEFNGNKHIFITDVFYVPVNLVHDVKDGGSNKNTHPDMQEYRDKQIAKEKAVIDSKSCNYIRITDNDFTQLMDILMTIKHKMIVDDKDLIANPIIHINESGMDDKQCAPDNGGYIIVYGKNEHMLEYAYTKDLVMDDILILDKNGNPRHVNKSFFEDCFYNLYEITDKDELSLVDETKIMNKLYTTEATSLDVYGFDLTKFDIKSILREMGRVRVYDQLMKEFYTDVVDPSKYKTVLFENTTLDKAKALLRESSHLELREDYNGVYVYNINNGNRTIYFESVDKIRRLDINLVRG